MAVKRNHIGEKKEVTVVIRRPVMDTVLYEVNSGGRYTIGEYFCHIHKRQDLISIPPTTSNNFIGGYAGYTMDHNLDTWGPVY